jgi:hypothetical protein
VRRLWPCMASGSKTTSNHMQAGLSALRYVPTVVSLPWRSASTEVVATLGKAHQCLPLLPPLHQHPRIHTR